MDLNQTKLIQPLVDELYEKEVQLQKLKNIQPSVVFDALSESAARRTSIENVMDVLVALERVIPSDC